MGPICEIEPLIQERLDADNKKRWIDKRSTSLRPALKEVSSIVLKKAYEEISSRLTMLNQKEAIPTSFEKKLIRRLRQETKLEFWSSLWIGFRNIDVFFPSLGGVPGTNLHFMKPTRRFCGLAIEVDGGIHNSVGKMGKDQSKYELLSRLGIGLLVIENEDIQHSTVRGFIQNVRSIPRLDSRARDRLWRSIYVETILANASDEDIKVLLGIEAQIALDISRSKENPPKKDLKTWDF